MQFEWGVIVLALVAGGLAGMYVRVAAFLMVVVPLTVLVTTAIVFLVGASWWMVAGSWLLQQAAYVLAVALTSREQTQQAWTAYVTGSEVDPRDAPVRGH